MIRKGVEPIAVRLLFFLLYFKPKIGLLRFYPYRNIFCIRCYFIRLNMLLLFTLFKIDTNLNRNYRKGEKYEQGNQRSQTYYRSDAGNRCARWYSISSTSRYYLHCDLKVPIRLLCIVRQKRKTVVPTSNCTRPSYSSKSKPGHKL